MATSSSHFSSMHELHDQRYMYMAGTDKSYPGSKSELDLLRLSQVEHNIKRLNLSKPAYSPHRKNNSPADSMEKYIHTQHCDSGIVTGSASPRYDDDETSTYTCSVVHRWDQATQGGYDRSYNSTPKDLQAISEIQTSASHIDRVKAVMFPETLTDFPHTNTSPEQATNLQRLTEPSHVIKTSLNSLLAYKSDADVTTKVIPDLLRVLRNGDRDLLEKAGMVMDTLAKGDSSRLVITSSPELLTALIQAISTNVNDEAAKYSASILSSFSNSSKGIHLIYSCDGINFLIKLLTSEVEYVVMFAITCLHNMLSCEGSSSTLYKKEFRVKGGVQHLVRLSNGNRIKILALITDCLHILAHNDSETKLVIYNYNGPILLVKIISENNYEKLLWTTGRLLKILALCHNNKQAIVQAGGLSVFAKHLNGPSLRITQLYLRILLTLSDITRPEDQLDHLIQIIITLLKNKIEIYMMTSIAGILSNISCNNPQNKVTICDFHGIEILLNLCAKIIFNPDIDINAPHNNELLEGFICTLRHITVRHDRCDWAQNEIRLHRGLSIILQLFLNTTHWTLLKACLGLIRNLALSSENRVALRDLTIIPQVIVLIRLSFNLFNQSTLQDDRQPENTDGVNMESVLMLGLATIEILARDPYNRNFIGSQNLVPLLLQLLYSECKKLVEHAACCLCELAQDPDNVKTMERAGAVTVLAKLIKSTNDEKTTLYSCMTVHRITQLSNQDVGKPMNPEIMTAIQPPIIAQPGNVTPIGELEFYPVPEEQNIGGYFSPQNTGFMPNMPSHSVGYHGHHCLPVEGNAHIGLTPGTDNLISRHHMPDDLRIGNPFMHEKSTYFDPSNSGSHQQYQMMHSMSGYPPHHPQHNLQYNYNPLMEYSTGPNNSMSNFYPHVMQHEHPHSPYQSIGHDLSHTNYGISHQDYSQANWNM